MLVEIRCEKFREKAIEFHSGLNVVLGDSVATNSIGKSTLLMIIDFAFGGESFINHNKDVVDELGHHSYFFVFEFGGNRSYFRRGTFRSDLIYRCDKNYGDVEPISIEDYTAILKASYSLGDIDLSFRSIVSLFSRVWGKENLDVKHPLHSFKNQKSQICVTNTIKLFKKYEPIRILEEDVKTKFDERTIFNKAAKTGFISKITKTEYKENVKIIAAIDSEIEEIKNNLKKYAIDISEIVNREILELKTEKDILLSEKLRLDSRLIRVRKDLVNNKAIKSKHFKPLLKYFPNVNASKLEEVEYFHSSIAKILRKELKSSEAELSLSLESIFKEIERIDLKIAASLEEIDGPEVVIDRVCDLSQNHTLTSQEIENFETDVQSKFDLKKAKELLATEKVRILELIENIINEKNRRNVTEIYSEERRSPTLSLSQGGYKYELMEDTGTGKAYSNMILLDLALLEATALPFVVHDSVLFKNIQNDTVAKLVDLYESIGKQEFIAIDEIQKYGDLAAKRLIENMVVQLNENNVLYVKDWRK